MRRIAILLLFGLTYVRAETPAEALRSMVQSERNFFQAAQEKGTRAAFLEFFADDAIVFRPGPVNGKQVWRDRKRDLELIWQPSIAVISRSADLGYDAGPSKWRVVRSKEEWTHAHYISIWKKTNDGSWKVAVDCATENPPPTAEPEPLNLGKSQRASTPTSTPFNETQRDFLTVAKGDLVGAVRQFGSDEVQLYRDGAFPVIGKQAAIHVLSAQAGGSNLEVMKTAVSSGNDLAYYYGAYSATAPSGKPSKGHFLQIWRTDMTGAWKVVLDWQEPLPSEQEVATPQALPTESTTN